MKKTPNEVFDFYMSGLPPRVRIAKSRDLCALGGIKPYKISDWRRGRSKIPLAWQIKINSIVGEQVFAVEESHLK